MRLPWHAWFRFLLVLALVLGPAIAFTGHQLASAWPQSPALRGLAWGLTALMWGWPLSVVLLLREQRAGWTHSLAFVLLGLAATLFMLLLAGKLAGWALFQFGLGLPAAWSWMALGLAALFSLWGWRAAFRPAQVTRHRIPIQGLHPGLQGLRIVQVSDLHISGLVGEAQVLRLVGQVQDLEPDLIAVTGDLVDGPRAHLAPVVRQLAGLRAPLGVHFVTGNHEYFWGVDSWLEELRGLGWELLTNAHRLRTHRGARLLVLGVNDPTARQLGVFEGPDLGQALQGAPEADFSLFLAHQPSAFSLAEAAGSQLFLAGHTHGGQFFPFNLLIGFFHKYARGLHRHGGLWIYVHAGSGFWGPPSRLGVPPEIAVLELERA